jgi:F-type H+-transporting ATPase subunit delta
MASISRIASRYAKSLIDLASERGSLDSTYQEMLAMEGFFGNSELLAMLKSPVIAPGKKAEVFKALFDGKLEKLSYEFMLLVIRKGRESVLPEIVAEFIAQFRKIRNIVPVKVISAVALDDNAMQSVKKRLLDTGTLNGELLMSNKVNPSIIGGFQIEFEDKLIDASIAHKLDLLRRELRINLYESKIRSL